MANPQDTRRATRTAATNAPAYAEEWQTKLAADPIWMAAYQAYRQNSPLPGVRPSGGPKFDATMKAQAEAAQEAMRQREQQLGFERPHDYQLNVSQPTPTFQRANYAERNKDWIVPAVITAATLGPFAAAALASPAAGVGASAPAAATAPTISTTAPIAPSALPGAHAATTVGAFAPTAAKAGGWGKAIRELIPLALQVGGNLGSQAINSSGIDKAVAAQQAGTDAAQARIDAAQRTVGDVYNQQRSDYQTVANVPMQALGNALGIPIGDIGPVSFTGASGGTLGSMAQMDTPIPGTWQQPIETPFPLHQDAQPQTLGQMAQPSAPPPDPAQRAQLQAQSSYVRFRSPDGQEGQIPRTMMRQAIAAGGTPLEA